MRCALSLVALAAALLTAVPLEALASLDLASGQTAIISDANGDPVNLRTKPRTSSDILASLPEGTRLEILEGPIADGSGNWTATVSLSYGTHSLVATQSPASGIVSSPSATVTVTVPRG